MEHWSRGEASAFSAQEVCLGSGEVEAAVAIDSSEVLAEQRSKAIVLLRWLAAQQGNTSDFPAAVTLFDALQVKSRFGKPMECSQEHISQDVLEAVQIAGVGRIAAKCGATVAFEAIIDDAKVVSAFVTNYARHTSDAHSALQAAQKLVAPALITQAEAFILTELKGRIMITSPNQWARTILARLDLLGERSLQNELAEAAISCCSTWATQFTERVAASENLQPKALGLGAVALGLVFLGVLVATDLKPEPLLEASEEWQNSFLAHMGHAADERYRGSNVHSVWTISSLAEAGLCRVEELRKSVFDAVKALELDVNPRA